MGRRCAVGLGTPSLTDCSAYYFLHRPSNFWNCFKPFIPSYVPLFNLFRFIFCILHSTGGYPISKRGAPSFCGAFSHLFPAFHTISVPVGTKIKESTANYVLQAMRMYSFYLVRWKWQILKREHFSWLEVPNLSRWEEKFLSNDTHGPISHC